MPEDDDLRSRVEQGLDTLRAGFADDGADLELTRWLDDRGVEISLTLRPDACEECIVSTELLQTMVDGVVRQAAPEIGYVRVCDPRLESVPADPHGEESGK